MEFSLIKIRRILKTFKTLLIIINVALGLFAFINLYHPPIAGAHLYKGLSVLDHLVPVPQRKLSCYSIREPEFHSLRPYQAAPCGDSPKAYFCWNNYTINEGISRQWGPDCNLNGGYYQCPDPNPSEIEKIYSVDGEYARWPILGNTEQVINSQNDEDTFSDPRKVNDYVSWYLNGTIGRAEYPPLDPEDPEDIRKITSLSGPLNRLLPLAHQQLMKIEAVENASELHEQELDSGEVVLAPENHNQIVVCAERSTGLFGRLLSSVLGLEFGKMTPVPCYEGSAGEENKSPANGEVFRLKPPDTLGNYDGWGEGELSAWNSVYNRIGDLVALIQTLLPLLPADVIQESLLDHWNKRIPPLPWGEDQQGNPMTAIKYKKYYNEWRGQTCILVPIVNALYCLDSVYVPNEYADLFPYVPLANTADKNAQHLVNGVQMKPSPGTIAYYDPAADPPDPPATTAQLTGENPQIVHNPVLFYPHTEETLELSDKLNQSFSPKEPVPEGEEPEPPTPDYENLGCEIVDVRSNPGDYLFPSSQDSGIDDLAVYVDVQIDAVGCPAGPIDKWLDKCDGQEQPAEFTVPNCPDPSIPGCYPRDCRRYPNCSGSINFFIPTTPKIPWAEQIWRSTVVNQESTFRRIFPKVGENQPVECIADLTGTTGIYYVPLPDPGYTPLVSVETPLATNPSRGAYGQVKSELYFPWQGTIYEYFLRGIQTALKPKGFGSPIPQGTQCFEEVVTGCIENVSDSAVPSKYQGSFKDNFIDLADRWSAACPGPENNMAEECYNWVVSESDKAGVNPAFALTIWLNESGASNYCEGGPTTQDFGMNLPEIYQNIGEQLAKFLDFAHVRWCAGISGFAEPMHGWLSRFQSSSGSCDPGDPVATQYYYEVMNTTWSWVSGCYFGNFFGIDWPTDMRCP